MIKWVILMTAYGILGHHILFYVDMSHFLYYVMMTSWLRNIKIISSSWLHRYGDSYCMNHTNCLIKTQKKTCCHDSLWKIKLTSWLDNSTAVKNRLVGKRMPGLVEKHIGFAYIQPLGGAKYSFHIGSIFSAEVYRLVRLLTAVETHLVEKPRVH